MIRHMNETYSDVIYMNQMHNRLTYLSIFNKCFPMHKSVVGLWIRHIGTILGHLYVPGPIGHQTTAKRRQEGEPYKHAAIAPTDTVVHKGAVVVQTHDTSVATLQITIFII